MNQFGILYKREDALLFRQWANGGFFEDTMVLSDLDDEIMNAFSDTSVAVIELKEYEDGVSFSIRSQIETDIDLASRHIISLDQIENFDDMIEMVVEKFRGAYGEHYGYTVH